MIVEIDIRNFVTMESFSGCLGAGLTVITGETGAGKSVFLRALSAVLGGAVQKDWVRAGAEEASVSVALQIPAAHPVTGLLAEAGLEGPESGALLLRRVVRRNGQSRAYVQDRPVSIAFLQALGTHLAEIHGQHAHTDLFTPSTHGDRLDRFCIDEDLLTDAAQAWANVSTVRAHAEALQMKAAELDAKREELRIQSAALDELAPQPEEWDALQTRMKELKALRQHGETFAKVHAIVSERVESELITAVTLLAQASRLESGDAHDQSLEGALEEALRHIQSVEAELARKVDALGSVSQTLDETEQRVWDYRDAARLSACEPADLHSLHQQIACELELLGPGGSQNAMAEHLAAAEERYAQLKSVLRASRQQGAARLSQAIEAELRPLKMGHARFDVALEESSDGPRGADRVEFRLSTQPGTAPRPIHKAASGGELARIALALRLVLAETHMASTLVFDEIDQGTGGAVASAIGERLSRLACDQQVIAVTHSPQVAAHADHHLAVSRETLASGLGRTRLETLEGRSRRDEIARMLAGRTVTEEARAAAGRLLGDEVGRRKRKSPSRDARISA